MFGKKKEEEKSGTHVKRVIPDMIRCEDMQKRCLDVFYEKDDTTLLEWEIVLSRLTFEVDKLRAQLAVKTAIASVQMIPVPVPIGNFMMEKPHAQPTAEPAIDDGTHKPQHYA